MTYKLMPEARQTEIVDATRKAADLHLEGMGASEAIAKCASEIGANPQVAQRMVEAFNTAKTLAHLKTADPLERADTFEMADADQVREILFPRGAKAALAREPAVRPNDDEKLELPDSRAPIMKAASSPELSHELFPGSPTVPMDADRRYSQAFLELGRLEKRARDHRFEGEKYRVTAERAIEKLASHLRGVGAVSWPRFAKEATTLYREEARPLLDLVYEAANLQSLKIARDEASEDLVYVDTQTEAHKLFKIAMYAVDLAAEEFATSQKYVNARSDIHATLMGIGTERQEKRALDPVMGMLAYSQMQQMMDKHMDEMIPKDKPSPDFSRDVGVESELDKAKLQATVRDLMEGDDVVARHAQENPGNVTQAIQELSRMSPEIVRNPMLLRGALRRQLEMGQLEPFELKQIQDVSKPTASSQGSHA